MIRALSCASLLMLLAIPVPAAAQDSQAASSTTRLIPFSAMLPDAGPDTIAGARSITFALFDEADGGTMLWRETQTVSVDARGRYSAHLGAVTALPLEIFRTEQARWLEVTVDGTALPRTMLVAVPYALRAADAETLGGRALSEFVLTDADGRRVRADGTHLDDPAVDGTGVPNQLAKWNGATTLSSSIITESFDNRIGVFAPDPTGGGVVDSRFTVRHLDGNTAIGVLNTANQRRFALNISPNGWQMYDGAGNVWTPGLRQQNGNVIISGASEFVKLEVIQTGDTAAANFASTSLNLPAVLATGENTGLRGQSVPGFGVVGHSFSGAGVRGTTIQGLAGQFLGDVSVSGTLTKGGGAFEIDHPLDPANKYLRHSFVESPDMMNVYNGNVMLDAKGEAWVTLPEWFETLNSDFRYQLTSIRSQSSPYIAEEIAANRFKIAGGTPHGKVSWQVTGIRQDAWAKAHRIVVEEDKKGNNRGHYVHPDVHGVGPELAVPSNRLDSKLIVTKR